MNAEPIKIGAVIVSYNSGKWLKLCLNSINKSKMAVDYIIIIDNNSEEPIMMNEFDANRDIDIINLITNVGFGRACNIGIMQCLKKHCNYILLVNPDVKLNEFTIENLFIPFYSDKTVGISGGVALCYTTNNFNSISRNMMKAALRHIGKKPFIYSNFDEKSIMNASLILISKNCILNIGAFDPIFFMYAEDNDFLRRAKLINIQMAIATNAFYHHEISHSYKTSNNPSGMSYTKLFDYARSSGIYALTNPYTNFAFNQLRLIYIYCQHILQWYKKPPRLLPIFKSIRSIPWIKCYYKWKMDNAIYKTGNADYYIELLIKTAAKDLYTLATNRDSRSR